MTWLVVGIGELLWDMLPGGRELGGAPANLATHVESLGGSGVVASAVGNDDSGQAIISLLTHRSLMTDYISIDSAHPTGRVEVSLDANGSPHYTIAENVAWDFLPPASTLMQLAERCDAVVFGSLAQRSTVSRDTIRQFVRLASSGALRIFDVNLRQSYHSREILRWSIGACDVLKLNDDELPFVAEALTLEGDETQLLDGFMRGFGLKMVALTKGERGSILRSSDGAWISRGHPTRVVDTVGAGDAFTAALVVGLLAGWNPDKINDHASRVAAFVCSRRGATPALPASLRMIPRET